MFPLLQENFEQKHDLLIEETELKQVVYVFSCSNSTLQVKGKINSIIIGELAENRTAKITLHYKWMISDYYVDVLCISLSSDNCKKLGMVFENVVGIVEVINSKAIQLQVSKTFKGLKIKFIK